MSIAERLIFLRGEQSRRSFADQLGLTESTLRNYEQGKSSPDSEVLSTVCNILRIAPEWLLLGTGPMRAGEPVPPPLPQGAAYPADVISDAVEVLEEFLTLQRRSLTPRVKAEFILQMCQMAVEHEAEGEEISPGRWLHVLRTTLDQHPEQ